MIKFSDSAKKMLRCYIKSKYKSIYICSNITTCKAYRRNMCSGIADGYFEGPCHDACDSILQVSSNELKITNKVLIDILCCV